MSKTPLITNPKLINAAIQEIQILLGDLAFIEKSFGLAEIRTRDNKVIPTVYQGEKLDEFDVGQTDALKSYCFWDKTDPMETIYPEDREPSKMKYARLSYNVALIFYTFDIKRLSLTGDVRSSKTFIMQELLKLLERGLFFKSDLVIKKIYDNKIADIFKGYTTRDINQPQYGIRFECELSFQETCYL